MKCLPILCLILSAVFMLPAHAASMVPVTGAPAGILLYAQEADGSVWLLLADHTPPSQRGWAAFGGSHDAGETLAETAARETEEETGGYFKRADLLKAIEGQQPVFDGVYGFYFVQVDKVPVAQIEAAAAATVAAVAASAAAAVPATTAGSATAAVPAATARPAAAAGAAMAAAYTERGPFAWVPYTQVERWLDASPVEGSAIPRSGRLYFIDEEWLPPTTSSQARVNWFWPVWLNNLRVARAAGVIPWQASAPASASGAGTANTLVH